MPKTLEELRNLNWPRLIVGLGEAFAISIGIAFAADFSWRGFGVTLAVNSAKCLRDFFAEAQKQLQA